jgi:MoxR-like ATPase
MRTKDNSWRGAILFFLVGPPGTGKMMIASVLAGKLQLSLCTIMMDKMVTKFMDETSVKGKLIKRYLWLLRLFRTFFINIRLVMMAESFVLMSELLVLKDEELI